MPLTGPSLLTGPGLLTGEDEEVVVEPGTGINPAAVRRGPPGPTLTWPLKLSRSGRLESAEQDSEEDIESCVVCVLSYAKGWRTDDTDFGRPNDLVFKAGGPDPAEIAAAINDQEPRATPSIVASAIENARQAIRIYRGSPNAS